MIRLNRKFDRIKYINHKVGNMLEALFALKNCERVCSLFLQMAKGYAKEIADFYDSSVDPIKTVRKTRTWWRICL